MVAMLLKPKETTEETYNMTPHCLTVVIQVVGGPGSPICLLTTAVTQCF